MEFAEALRAMRMRRGWTQVELAEQAAVSARTVTGLESGRVRPRPATARLLADALGLTGADRDVFLTGDAEPETPPQHPRQLPHDVPTFTGRRDELAELDTLLAGAVGEVTTPTIVTIDGAPGIGKTTLAVHWAHRAARHFPDVQLYLNLRGYGPGEPIPPAGAAETLLRALGVPSDRIPSDVDERGAMLRTAFAGRRALLLLDNARDAGQVRPLLPGTGAGLVLVTSRNQLRGLSVRDGAHRVTLRRLPRHQSVELLAAAVGPERVAREPAAADRLAELCDQVPLALAIVAERAHRAATLAEVVAALTDERARLDHLGTGENDPQADLRAAMSWSYHALGADAAAMFRDLGLHPATDIGVATAAALADVSVARARALLDQLVAVHLVEQRRPGRYELHDLIRLYATEMANVHGSADERQRTIRRVLDWYLHAAVRADRRLNPNRRHDYTAPYVIDTFDLEPVVEGRAWFEQEYDCLRAVIAWAVTHGWAGHAWRLSVAMTTFFDSAIPWRDGMEFFESAFAAASTSGEVTGEAYTLNSLGCLYLDRTDLPAARSFFEQSLARFRSCANKLGEGIVLGNLGLVHGELGQGHVAREYTATALELFEVLGDARGISQNLDNFGVMLTVAGRYQEAVERHLQAHAINERVGDPANEAMNQHNLGRAYAGLGSRALAIRAFRTSIGLHRAAGNRRWEAIVLTELAKVLADAGHAEISRQIEDSVMSMLNALDAGLARALG